MVRWPLDTFQSPIAYPHFYIQQLFLYSGGIHEVQKMFRAYGIAIFF